MNNNLKTFSMLILLLVTKTQYATPEPDQPYSNAHILTTSDPRFIALSLLGVTAGAFGLWIIKQSVDKMLTDTLYNEEASMREKILTLGSRSLATLIGLACTIGGGMLIITDKYKITCSSNS